jgi:putative ABC transport system permease protein
MPAVLQALRELRRRVVRSALTAGGIAIGVAALVLLGALSEKLDRLVGGGRDFAAGQISVSGAGAGAMSGMSRGGLLSAEQLASLAAVAGVERVAPIVMFPASDVPAALPFTLAPLVFGVDVEALLLNREAPPPRVQAGHLVPAADGSEVVVGSQVARFLKVDVGSSVQVRGQSFRVAGILEQTFTGPDSFMFMPYPMAERLLVDSEPLLRRMAMVPGAKVLPIATAAAVFWKPGEDPEALAEQIRGVLPALSVVSPAEGARQIDRALFFLTSVIVGSGLAALLVASLAVTNTMFTAVVERRREIGLRRVVGATRSQVVAQLVLEAAILGFIGGALGIAGGAATVGALNALTERLGATVFLITPRLTLFALVLPAALAILAGLWPAWRAARLPPTQSIRFA